MKYERQIPTEKIFIVDKYECLMYYNEPLVYSGLTSFNERVVIAVLESSRECLSDFHAIIAEEQYQDYINKKIDLREVFKIASLLAISFFNSEESEHFKAFEILFENVPEENLPDHGSFL